MTGADSSPNGAAGWARRRPRFFAAALAAMIGTLLAAVFTLLYKYFMKPPQIHEFFFNMEAMVLLSAFWAFLLYGSHCRRRRFGLVWSMVSGVIAISLAVPTYSLFDSVDVASYVCNRCFVFTSTTYWSQVWFETCFTFLLTVSLLLAPQIVAALGGAMIWRVIRDEGR